MKCLRYGCFLIVCVNAILAKEKSGDLFKTSYLEAAQLQKKEQYKQAYYILKESKPQESLDELYRQVLLADLKIQQGQLKEAYALYKKALRQTSSANWKKHISEKMYRAFARESRFLEIKKEFYQEQVSGKSILSDSIQITMLLDLLDYVGSWKDREMYLEKLFLLDPLDPRLKLAYKKYVTGRLYSKNKAMEFSIARYEENTHKHKNASDRVLYILNSTKIKRQEVKAREIYIRLCLKTREYDKGIRSGKKYVRLSKPNANVLLNIARLYNGKGDKQKSRYWYNRFMQQFPDHYKTQEIYWLRGWEAEYAYNYEDAIRWYKKLLPRFEKEKRGRWSRFRIGFCYYKQKKYKQALIYFRQAEKQTEGRLSIPAALYWKANTFKKMGELDSAYHAYKESYQSYPYTFYGHMALKTLKEDKELEKERKSQKAVPPLTLSKTLNWLGDAKAREWLEVEASLKSAKQSVYLGSTSLSISDLMINDLDTLAKITIESAYHRHKNNLPFLYHYSKLFQEKFPEFSYKLARRLSYRMSLASISRAPGDIVSLFYPLYYKEIVEEYGNENKVPIYFIQALMKQESGFQAEVISRAGAIGLMQIMPATGKNLAKRLGIVDYDPSSLRNPEFNVKLGVDYLRGLMSTYNSNLFLVLANYNAGPRPTKRWHKQNGHKSLDEFVEEVSYWETRDYLKKVMGNYWNYKYIYGSVTR
jgi:tetratricopeptide (TPR) repeat protein